nr:hypothetical protein [Tanacetum cinerariifolium]
MLENILEYLRNDVCRRIYFGSRRNLMTSVKGIIFFSVGGRVFRESYQKKEDNPQINVILFDVEATPRQFLCTGKQLFG